MTTGVVDSLAFVEAAAEVVASLRVATGDAQGALIGVVAAGGQAHIGLCRGVAAAAGEDLDDPADGVRAIQ